MKKFLLSLLGAAACLTASATDYELVTSAGELIPGDNYIVVARKTPIPTPWGLSTPRVTISRQRK